MEITFDPAKDAENKRRHGLSLRWAEDFDIDTAYFAPENSQDYGEERWKGIGWLDAVIHTIIFVFEQKTIRVVSLRRATKVERKEFAENT